MSEKPQINTAKMLYPFVDDIYKKSEKTQLIAEFIEQHMKENPHLYDTDNSHRRAQRVANCGKSWIFDLYQKQGVKVLKRIYLCKNKFCLNCQKQRQLTRLLRFGPELDKAVETHDLYHLTLTSPNCAGYILNSTIKDKIFKACKSLINSMTVTNRNCKAEFRKLGCTGVLRSLEITYDITKRKKNQEYNPHLHCIVALKKDIDIEGQKDKIHPKFSYDITDGKKEFKRYFSDIELLLQRVWFLLINGQKVTKHSIGDYRKEQGYSVTLDLVDENSYYEVFKYASKLYDENSNPMAYEQWETLDDVLHGKRTIQGYGSFYGIQIDDSIEEGHHKAKQVVEAILNKIERPVTCFNHINEVKDDMVNKLQYVYLNFKLIHTMGDEELDELLTLLENDPTLEKIVTRLEAKRRGEKVDKKVEQYRSFFMQLHKRYPTDKELAEYRERQQELSEGKTRTEIYATKATQESFVQGKLELSQAVKKPPKKKAPDWVQELHDDVF